MSYLSIKKKFLLSHILSRPLQCLEYVPNSLDASTYMVAGIGDVTDGNIAIKEIYIDGNGVSYPVTRIDQDAFSGDTTVVRAEIPRSVNDIALKAFYQCENLRNLYFHKNPGISLGQECFSCCNSLEEVIVPIGVTNVGDNAFRECLGLKKVIINGSTGERMFCECTNLEEAHIGDAVEDLAERIFQRCSILHTIVLGSGVKTIGSDAFRRCLALAHIAIPQSVTSINSSAFLGCTGLLEFTVEEENSYYKAVDGNLYSKDGADFIQYAIGKAETHFVIPEGVERIASYAFHSCTNITHITVPKSVTSIGSNSFRNCENIQMIDFSAHESVPTLKNAYAFGGTPRSPFIIVPDTLYDEWIATEVWSTIAETGRITKASEITT